MTRNVQEPSRITKVLAVPAVGAGYYEDLAALQTDYVALPQRFTAPAVTQGFRAVREVAEGVSVGVLLDTGQIAWGDCMAVSHSGTAGREPVFRTKYGLAAIRDVVAPILKGRAIPRFRELAEEVDALGESVEVIRPASGIEATRTGGVSRRALITAPARMLQAARGEETPTERVVVNRRLHPAIRYGVSQALLRAIAAARNLSMAEVIAEEWNLPLPEAMVPIHAQSGGERYYNAEKMIARRVASLPHALVDDIPGQVGKEGAELTRYLRWLSQRIRTLGGYDYQPTIHLDLHGALGKLHDNNADKMTEQLRTWESTAQPYRLRVESPVLRENRQAQIWAMKTLKEYANSRKLTVEIVADEWANTLDDIRAFVETGAAHMIHIKMPDLGSIHNSVEAVLVCKEAGASTLLGGSYAETEISARASVHVALATQPDLIMAKPGLGTDEAICLVQNEMKRTLSCIRGHAG
jgi:methylaspartate ammonia-lyase